MALLSCMTKWWKVKSGRIAVLRTHVIFILLTHLMWFLKHLFLKQGNVFQDAVFNQTVTVIEREDGLDGET